MMDKATVIRSIQAINRSAEREWLEDFDLDELRLYLAHLRHAAGPRGGRSAWVRPGDTPPIVACTGETRRTRLAW
jgi:hypothetical protein